MEGDKIRLRQGLRQNVNDTDKKAGQLLFATYDETITAIPIPTGGAERGGAPVQKTISQGDIYFDLSGGNNGVRVNIANDVDKARTLYSGRTLTSDMAGSWNISQLEGVHELYDGLTIAAHISTGSSEEYNTLNVNGLGPELVWRQPGVPLYGELNSGTDVLLTFRTSGIGQFVTPAAAKNNGSLPASTTISRGWVVVSQLNIDLRAVLGTTAIGSNTQPIYWSGQKFDLMTTVGSSTKPVYFNAGTITAGSTYAGGTRITLNGTSQASKSVAFYAPAASGEINQLLISKGVNASPEWIDILPTMSGGTGNGAVLTANRVIISMAKPNSTDIIMGHAASLYTTGANLAINKTSITSGFTFEVNGASRLWGGDTLFSPSGDATLRIYDVTNTTYGKETIAIQTCFDGQDPKESVYVSTYENRTNLLLQPRGGQVYIGYNLTGVGNTNYTLLVNGTSQFYSIYPEADNKYTLGFVDNTTTLRWKGVYTTDIDASGDIIVGGKLQASSLDISGTVSINQTLTINSTTDATQHTTNGAVIVKGGLNVAKQIRGAADLTLYCKTENRSIVFGMTATATAASGGAGAWKLTKTSANKLTLDYATAASTWSTILDFSASSTVNNNITVVRSSWNPAVTKVYTLGTSSAQWTSGYIQALNVNKITPIDNNALAFTDVNTITFTSKNNTTSALTITNSTTATVVSPAADNISELGEQGKRWKAIYVDQLYPDYLSTIATYSVSASWTDLTNMNSAAMKVIGTDSLLSGGTYIVQIHDSTNNNYWSGIMSWPNPNSTLTGTVYTEVPLHGAGNSIAQALYLRVVQDATSKGAKLQISASVAVSVKL